MTYNFVSRDEFLQLVKEDRFEEYGELNGFNYGNFRAEASTDSIAGELEPLSIQAELSRLAVERKILEDMDRKQRDKDLGPLPEGWELHFLESGQEYFVK